MTSPRTHIASSASTTGPSPATSGKNRSEPRPRSIILLHFAFLLLVSSFAVDAAAQQSAGGDWGGGARGWFDSEARGAFDENGKPAALVSVVIPRRNLIFIRESDGRFRAGYQVRVVQRDAKANLLRTQVWDFEVIVNDYPATRDSSPEREELSFELAPSKEREVDLTVRVDLEQSARFGKRSLPIARPSVPGSGIALGDVGLYRLRLASAEPNPSSTLEYLGRASADESYRRSTTKIFDLSSGPPFLLVQVYDLRPGVHTDSITVEVLVKPGNGDAAASWRRRFRFAAGPKENAAILGLPATAFRTGNNRIETVLVGGDDRVLEIQNFGLDPSVDSQWEENLRVIQDLAGEQEYKRLEDAASDERLALWAAFWAGLDPEPQIPGNPRLEQHFARVSYARENFRDGGKDGALSDRGRVYIRLGPPDSIESQSMLQETAAEFELWHYLDRKVIFYFRDDGGLGHWRLVWREQS